ncbi:efflux RND transporter periplasmic adaptor subunit [Candidatus Venteria ishoeyi]|nr:efflux RND transporter periplasmic adaptor subunit [Candidatus Venteria ishoeyi]MDM8546897.1 efflux RND transporter periplasmic adaptor subunit [Candidatus Venteria ishoeyi]
MFLKKIRWPLLFLMLGFVVVFIAMKMKQPPQQVQRSEFATKARFIKVSMMPVQLKASGFGTVQAAQSWEAVAEVAGRVHWLAKDLKDGIFVTAGDELLRIDDSEYRLVLAQIDAQIKASKVKYETTQLSLKTTKRELNLLQNEYARQRALVKKGAISKSAKDSAERAVLNAKNALQNLESSLLINIAEREVLKVQRQQAKLNIERCSITAPLDLRVTQVLINPMEYVNRGQKLITADGINKAEVIAQFPVGKLRPLVRQQIQGRPMTDSWVPGVVGLQALIKLNTPNHRIIWPAKIERVSGSIQTNTQTLGIVATVEKPYADARSGKRPPLIRNMFVELELQGVGQQEQLVIPATALHEGEVYVINDSNRLEKRKVQVLYQQKGFVAIAKGLTAGESIVVSDLIPALDGMLLAPIVDKKTKKALMQTVAPKSMAMTESREKNP